MAHDASETPAAFIPWHKIDLTLILAFYESSQFKPWTPGSGVAAAESNVTVDAI